MCVPFNFLVLMKDDDSPRQARDGRKKNVRKVRCFLPGWLHDNTIYNPDGKMTVECGKSGMGTKGPPRQGRVFTEAEFQASGADPGSSARVTPPDDVIIGWARAMLEPLRPP